MAEINEAYSILSNPTTRKQYDSYRGEKTQSGDAYFKEDSNSPPSYDPLEKDWLIAAKYFPSLKELDQLLARISWKLSYSFRAHMIESKEFEKGQQIAEQMRSDFLRIYFGNDPSIVQFANELIFSGEKAAARDLNETIRVLGGSAKADHVIRRIKDDYALFTEEEITRETQPHIDSLVSAKYSVKRNGTCWVISKDGESTTVTTIPELIAFSSTAAGKHRDELLHSRGGLIVCSFRPGTSMNSSGLLVGDVIVKYRNTDVRYKKRDFDRAQKETEGLVDVRIHIFRNGSSMILTTHGGDIGVDVEGVGDFV